METFSALLALCGGEFTGHRWIPFTKASDAELYCFFDLCLNKRLRNNREAGDLRHHHAHYDFTVTFLLFSVYCGCCLGAHTLGSQLTEREIKPQFYVNIADIDMLETEMSYIACK